MHPAIQTRHDRKRGCGFRKPGGLYLCSDGLAAPCGKLPVPLTCCPTCGHGIKFSRSWTWVNGTALLAEKQCQGGDCLRCPAARPLGRCGLIWVGGKFYQTPEDFSKEAAEQGVSRRIKAVPKEFEVGKTWVLLAHLQAIWETCPDCKDRSLKNNFCETCDDDERGIPVPAIFRVFLPQRIEYVCKGTETAEEIDALVKRGLTPVVIEHQSAEEPSLYVGDNGMDEDGL